MYRSSVVQIGNIALGGKNPVRIQSMTTTNTMDTTATVAQVKELALAGCDYVRITTQTIKEAENLKNIKDDLQKDGLNIPLIADVHFNPKVAEVAACYAEKVRINPGNYIDIQNDSSSKNYQDTSYSIKRISENIAPLLNICKQYNTAIRIGTNHGSLSQRILFMYGNTAHGMVESIMEFVQICNQLDFHNLVLSLKASNARTMIEANMLLVNRLSDLGLNYPLHLGVTEAGSEDEGRVKSAAGIGYLLAHGIGDTIRVSLTENPIEEIPVALNLVEFFGLKKDITKEITSEIVNFPKSKIKPPLVVTSKYSSLSDLSAEKQYITEKQQSNDSLISIQKFKYQSISYNDLIIRATVEASVILLKQETYGIWIENQSITTADNLAKLTLNILQVLGLRITKTEYIACPTCGRSTINVIKQLEEVKKQTSQLPGLKIAVMGCMVNGPGEMADAHYGFVGSGKEKVNIYKGKKIIHKNVSQENAVATLVSLIRENED